MQQQTPEWFSIKKGVISGTQLKAIMGTPKARQEAIYDIIGERLMVGIYDDYETPIQRGNRLEPEAIATYEIETGYQVETIGFCESDESEHMGSSPDGLIGESGAVEIKCPEHKNYVKYWITNEVPDEYIWQCTQYFVINEKLEWLDFVAYNPDIPIHPIHIIHVTRSEMMGRIEKAEKEQKIFLAEVNTILEGIVQL